LNALRLQRGMVLALQFIALVLAAPVVRADPTPVKIGVGNFPPYFSVKGTSGLFNDLIRETFALMPGYQITLLPEMSNYRLVQSLKDGQVDAAANIFAGTQIDACRSDPAFRFTDVAASRKDRKISIKNMSDLAGKRIVTYQGAKTFLGEQFAQIVDAQPSLYREVPQPVDQALSVANGGADVSVGDMYIFLYSIKTLGAGKYATDQFEIHRLFPDIYSHMAFRDPKLCEEFNRALRTLKKSGRYDAIYAEYLKSLQ
jgi:ABC-type amino acid transport substrate-binding protein